MIKLYHGTATSRAESIFLDREIRTTDVGNTQYAPEGHTKTTFGYVYLSKSVNEALGFGLLASKSNRTIQNITIFQVEIDEGQIEIDADEVKHRAIVTQVTLPEDSCVRINRKLFLKKDVNKFVQLEFENKDLGWELADDPLLEDKLQYKWREII